MQTSSPTADAVPMPAALRVGSDWRAIMVLAVTLFSASTMRSVFSPVQEAAKASLHISDMQLGLVQGLAASIPIALLALPLGRLIDRRNRVWLLIAMAAIWTVGNVMTAFVWDFPTLFVARMLAGLGAVCSVPVAISLCADFCPPESRGRAMMPMTMAIQIGTAAALALGGAVFAMLGAAGGLRLTTLEPWRETHLIFAAASALAMLPLFFLREPPRREVSEAGIGFGAALKEIVRRRAFLAPLFIGQVGVVMVDVAAGVWAMPVLARSYHLAPAQAGALLFLPLIGGGVLGAVIGGLAADMGHRLKLRGGVLLGGVIVSALAIPVALFPIMPSAAGFAWAIFAFILAGSIAGLVTAAALSILIPNEIRGLCLSAFIVVAAIVGFGAGPTVVTLASDALGGESHLNMALAVTGVAISAASFLGFLVAMLRAPRDAAG